MPESNAASRRAFLEKVASAAFAGFQTRLQVRDQR
jgi:hypothetical protein